MITYMPFLEVVALRKRIESHQPVTTREILDALAACRPPGHIGHYSFSGRLYPLYRHWTLSQAFGQW
jgi:hypothetical protein